VLTMLTNRTSTLDYDNKATMLRSAFADSIANNPISHGYFLQALHKQIDGETSARQYAAKGAVSIRRQWTMSPDKVDFSLFITIADGWHINAAMPLDKDLIATQVVLSDILSWQIEQVHYPKSMIKSLGFSQKPLALYEGAIEITGQLEASTPASTMPVFLEVVLQACNEQICLAPEHIKFRLLH